MTMIFSRFSQTLPNIPSESLILRLLKHNKRKLLRSSKGVKMIKQLRFIGLVGLLLTVVAACDPGKNTFLSRSYHSTTARYNGYFNANLLLDEAMDSYRKRFPENYYESIPFEIYPNEADVQELYPAIDTAIAKCTKVIEDHSMPGGQSTSRKKEENNTYIDENWITIGIAYYLRRDYDAAMKNFKFIKKFYKNDPSNYVGELWMAKTNIALNKVTDASFNLDNLEEVLLREEEEGKKSIKEIIAGIASKKDKDQLEVAKFPKEIRFEYEMTVAELALIKGDKEKAVEHLKSSLNHTRKRPEKARVYYILGQMYEQDGKRSEAQFNYNKVLKNNAPYAMQFSARLKRAFLGGDEKLVKQLFKMLRDEKNAEYKDQIYYALAQIELQKNNEPKTFEYLTQSAFYSTKNTRQKAMAYEQMGDLRFAKKIYVPAQKYYDSCANVMPEAYPKGEAIKNKAAKLSDLVVAVETAAYEDSVQRIAGMADYEREDFIKDVIKELKRRDKERKRLEAEKLASLQTNNTFGQTQGGAKWYFRNQKTRQEGLDEFKKQWGQRENEDNWRRSEKQPEIVNIDPNDSTAVEEVASEPQKADSLTVEELLKNIPLTDSAMAISRARLVEALYNGGIIYKDQLGEPAIAIKNFNTVVNKPYESKYKLMSAFELYKLTESNNPDIAAVHKQYIIGNYPNSDYANYLRDPDYFIKKKELEAQSQRKYVQTLKRYDDGLYYPALTEIDQALRGQEETNLTPKYLLLKALCQGQLNEDKSSLLPTLSSLVDSYPGTPEANKAQGMIEIIKNGYSKNIPVDFEDKSLYKYNDNSKHYVLVFLPSEENSSIAKSKVSDFSREYFSRSNLRVKSKIYGSDQSVILIEDFDNDLEAKEYVKVYKSTRKHLLDLQDAKIVPITQVNLKVLFETQKLEEYEDFYLEYY
jgi:tetratricopeptide (TPR) repeat protein